MEEEAKIPEGFEAMVAGETIPEGAMWLDMNGVWHSASGVTIGKEYDPSVPEVGKYSHAIHIKPINLNPGDGYRLLEEGDLFPHGYEYLSTYNGEWELGGLVGNRYRAKTHGTCRAQMPTHKGLSKEAAHNMLDDWESEANPDHSADVLRYGATKETGEAPKWTARMEVSTDLPKDPKTKYHRPMYPAWNDPQVHTDTNGRQYINVDVYSVLASFKPGDEAGHAVKKLLAAGTRDKGSKIQDYREAIISIEAAIYRAEIEGGNG